jgi:hypothetical protein
MVASSAVVRSADRRETTVRLATDGGEELCPLASCAEPRLVSTGSPADAWEAIVGALCVFGVSSTGGEASTRVLGSAGSD